jgi:death-on-curing protein
MESFLALNGFEISASVDEQEKIVLQVAAGKLERNHFSEWLRAHVKPLKIV